MQMTVTKVDLVQLYKRAINNQQPRGSSTLIFKISSGASYLKSVRKWLLF